MKKTILYYLVGVIVVVIVGISIIITTNCSDEESFIIYNDKETPINWHFEDSGIVVFRDIHNEITICKSDDVTFLLTVNIKKQHNKQYLGETK